MATPYSCRLLATPASEGKAAKPGMDVVYRIQVSNLGNVNDSFAVTTTAGWPVTAPTVIGPLAPGVSGEFEVTVHVPIDPAAADHDTCTLLLTSQRDPSQSASAQLETQRVLYQMFLPYLAR